MKKFLLKDILLLILVYVIVVLLTGIVIVTSNVKINPEIHWNNVFENRSFLDLMLSWPGIVSIGIGAYALVEISRYVLKAWMTNNERH